MKDHAGSNQELAAFLGVAESTVRRWNSPDFETSAPSAMLIKCCNEWDISPTWLFCGLGPKRLSQFAPTKQVLTLIGELTETVDQLKEVMAGGNESDPGSE